MRAGEIITDVTGHSVTHRAVGTSELLERLSAYPGEFAAILAALDADTAAGAEDRVTDTVARVACRPARDFRTFAGTELRRGSCGPPTTAQYSDVGRRGLHDRLVRG